MGWSKNKVTNPITGDDVMIRGYDNATQAELTFATNKMNYDMFHEEQDWNYNMWQKQNEYDSPEAQKQRLIEAGYNPLMLGEGAFGSSSPISTPSAPDMQTPDIEGNQYIESVLGAFDTMLHSINGAVQNLSTMQSTAQMPQYLANDVQRTQAEAQYKNALVSDIYNKMPWFDQMASSEIINNWASAEAHHAGAKVQKATEEYVKTETSWLPKIKEKEQEKIVKEMKVLDEQASLIKAEANLKDNESALCYQQMITEKSRGAIVAKEQEFIEKYGEQSYISALRNYDDAHAEHLLGVLEKYVSFDKDSRPAIKDALIKANISSDKDYKEFLECLQKLKDGKQLTPQQQTRWFEPLAALLPGVAAVGWLGVKAAAQFGSKAIAPLAIPQSNKYTSPFWNSRGTNAFDDPRNLSR